MHEFSLALNILEITEDAVYTNHVTVVNEIVLDIGVFAGIEVSALEFALESIKPGSILEKSKITINIIPGIAICKHCKQQFEPEDLFSPCPSCNNFGMEIRTGGELKVRTIIAE
jgi:hydrogenase nickel incorporation protein HypA/HybF